MIYISLCAMPDRMMNRESSERCFRALLNQNTDQPYKVLLNVPRYLKNYTNTEIPEWVINLQQEYQNQLDIIRDDTDYGPISNLLSPLKLVPMHPDDIIIVCDDDHEYHEDMIKYHLKKLEEYPSNHCICFRGNQPLELRTWYDSDNNKIGKFYNGCVLFPTPHDTYLKIPDHWHSVSYKRKYLNKQDLLDNQFLSITWQNDMLMGLYGWTHGLFFLCASYDLETDYRPVNYDGRVANSFPIKTMLPFESESGCNLWRQKKPDDPWDNPHFVSGMSADRGIMKL